MLSKSSRGWIWRAASALTLLGPLLLTGPASAQTPLPVGTSTVPPVANPVYQQVLATSTQPVFGVNANNVQFFSGTLQHAVVVNQFGTLDFLYQYTAAVSVNPVIRITNTDFTGFTTDVYYRTTLPNSGVGDPVLVPPFAGFISTGTIAPNSVDRFAAATVGWDFRSPPIFTGNTTRIFAIRTNATHYTVGSTNVIDGAIATVPTFAPSNVPEPAPIAMLGAGLLPLGLAFLRRRKGTPVEETPNS